MAAVTCPTRSTMSLPIRVSRHSTHLRLGVSRLGYLRASRPNRDSTPTPKVWCPGLTSSSSFVESVRIRSPPTRATALVNVVWSKRTCCGRSSRQAETHALVVGLPNIWAWSSTRNPRPAWRIPAINAVSPWMTRVSGVATTTTTPWACSLTRHAVPLGRRTGKIDATDSVWAIYGLSMARHHQLGMARPRRHVRRAHGDPSNIHSSAWQRLRRVILARDLWACGYCGAYADTVDHVVPRSIGGATTPDNLVACCATCQMPWRRPQRNDVRSRSSEIEAVSLNEEGLKDARLDSPSPRAWTFTPIRARISRS
jgi:5-methylcytosine-specific restriction endonuclease McrA